MSQSAFDGMKPALLNTDRDRMAGELERATTDAKCAPGGADLL